MPLCYPPCPLYRTTITDGPVRQRWQSRYHHNRNELCERRPNLSDGRRQCFAEARRHVLNRLCGGVVIYRNLGYEITRGS